MNKEKIVLVIEDERPLLEAVSLKLKKRGFIVYTARTVEEAKKCAEGLEHIDAFWLDHYLMGGQDGLDFVFWCKQDSNKHKDVPIFVVSNTASPDKVANYISLGVKEYYVKANHRLEDIIDEISKY